MTIEPNVKNTISELVENTDYSADKLIEIISSAYRDIIVANKAKNYKYLLMVCHILDETAYSLRQIKNDW